MACTDPIADFLTRIRNGLKAQHRYVDIDGSRLKQGLAEILKQQGLIENYLIKAEGAHTKMRLFLKYYDDRRPVIQGLKRVSTPGLRRYIGYKDIPYFFGGLGFAILSTSQGVMIGKEASEKKLGGELLCLVW